MRCLVGFLRARGLLVIVIGLLEPFAEAPHDAVDRRASVAFVFLLFLLAVLFGVDAGTVLCVVGRIDGYCRLGHFGALLWHSGRDVENRYNIQGVDALEPRVGDAYFGRQAAEAHLYIALLRLK